MMRVAIRYESLVRRFGDDAIARTQGKARGAGDLRIILYPSKHSRVRPPPGLSLEGRQAAGQGIPSPALTAKNKPSRTQIGCDGLGQDCLVEECDRRRQPLRSAEVRRQSHFSCHHSGGSAPDGYG
jgi:hypothetical protein